MKKEVKKGLSKEKKEAIAAVALFSLLGIVLLYQFVLSDSKKRPVPGTQAQQQAAPGNRIPARELEQAQNRPNAAQPRQPGSGGVEPVNTSATEAAPLNLALLNKAKIEASEVGRNIFAYPPPPPPPAPKPPPPPPPPAFTITTLNPGSVIAQTGSFSLMVEGGKFPQDAKVFFNGAQLQTTVISESQLKAEVPGSAITSAGTFTIQVRSTSDASKFSNQQNLTATAPPKPPYNKYVSRIGRGDNIEAILLAGDSRVTVRKGDTLGGRWKVLEITPQHVLFEDTVLKLGHRINFSVEGK